MFSLKPTVPFPFVPYACSIILLCPLHSLVGGYPKFSTFGCSVGERQPAGRDEVCRRAPHCLACTELGLIQYLQYHKIAISLTNSSSPELTRMIIMSQQASIFLVVGVIEKDGGSLFCTAVFIDPVKGFIGKHRKLMPS